MKKARAPDYSPVYRAEEAKLQAQREIANRLSPPDLNNLMVNLQRYDPNVVADPHLSEWTNQRDSELGDIVEDPRLRANQMEVLRALQEIADEGGLTPIEEAQFAQMQGELGLQRRAQRDAGKQEALATGTWGSGADILSRLMADQTGVNQASQSAKDLAAMAYQRKLEALGGIADLSQSVRSTDWANQSDVARANDTINNFNTSGNYRATVNNNSLLNAQQSERQRLQEQNVELQHAEQQNRVGAHQQNYQNQVAQANIGIGVEGSSMLPQFYGQNAQNQAAASNQNAANRMALIGSLIQAAGTVGSAYAGGGAK